MSFRRDRDQVCETLSGGPTTFYEGEVLSVFYETTEQAIKDVLPPGLKPYKKPLVMAGLNDFFRTNFEVGYKEAALYVACVHEDTGLRGFFVPGMTLDVDMGTVIGREVGGYPKKGGIISKEVDADVISGGAQRHGIDYFKIKGDFSCKPNEADLMQQVGEILTPQDPENHPDATIIFNYLWPASLWVSQENLKDAPPPVLCTVWKTKIAGEKPPKLGWGEVVYEKSKHDPWYALPVEKTLGAIVTYDGLELKALTDSADKYEVDAEQYLPHAFYGFDCVLE